MRTEAKSDILAGVSRETAQRLTAYVALLAQWSARMNLIGRCNEEDVWTRHIADCLQLERFIPTNVVTAADLGSGAGLPGLVLAIITDLPFTLVESDLRKAAFLREAARITGARATIFAARSESLDQPVDLVTARAFAPLPALLNMTPAALQVSATFLLLKGATAVAELEAARRVYSFDLDTFPSLTDTRGVILKLRHVRPL